MLLILGGTAEARELATVLDSEGITVLTSLAGRVARPRLPDGGEVRVGGFGGPEALALWLTEHDVDAVIDATHPFAERISASAARACAASGKPLLVLQRPGWSERSGDDWTWVGSLDEAAAVIPTLGERTFLTTGRQGLAAFAPLGGWFLIRCVDPPEPPLPADHEVLLDRGPYTLAGELNLIDQHRLQVVVTKDSGGAHTFAKLDAARERGLPLIVVRRPQRAAAETVTTVTEAIDWARTQVHAG